MIPFHLSSNAYNIHTIFKTLNSLGARKISPSCQIPFCSGRCQSPTGQPALSKPGLAGRHSQVYPVLQGGHYGEQNVWWRNGRERATELGMIKGAMSDVKVVSNRLRKNLTTFKLRNMDSKQTSYPDPEKQM